MEVLIGSSKINFKVFAIVAIAILLGGCESVIYNEHGQILRVEGANASGSVVMSDGRILTVDTLVKPFISSFEKSDNFQGESIVWNISYEDLGLRTGRGFDDQRLGGLRRQALVDTLEQVAADLDIRGARDRQIDVRIQESIFDPAATFIATAGTIFPKNNAGIFLGHALSRIQTGVDADPNPNVPDIIIQVNFSANFYLGSGNVPLNQFDFRTVLRHEIAHSIGFATMIGSDGNSRDRSNPRIYSTYDRLLRSADGNELVDQQANFVGSLGDLDGTNGNSRLMGEAAREATCGIGYEVYVPAPYAEGSSISHLDDINGGDVVMTRGLPPGVRNRSFSIPDNAVLRDLGFADAGADRMGHVYCEKAVFPAGGIIQAAAKAPFIDGNDDVIILTTSIEGGALMIYPEGDSSIGYRFRLPNGAYQGMTVGPFGLDNAPAIILSELDRENILVLSNLTLPQGRTVLVDQDFEFIHQAVGPNSRSNDSYFIIDPVVAVGNLDNSNGSDVLTASNDLGLIPFLRDNRGRFDKWSDPRIVGNISNSYNPQRDLAAYQNGGPTTIEISYGLGFPGQNIFALFEDDRPTTRSLSPDSGYKIMRWARKGVVALASVERSNGSNYLMRLRQEPSGGYVRNQIYSNVSSIGDIHIDSRSGASRAYISTADDNRIMMLVSSDQGPIVLAGSEQAGYRDGSAESALFQRPTALCQKDEKLFVIDAGNSVVRGINLSTNQVSTIAGRPNVSGDVDGPGERAVFSFASSSRVADSCTVVGDTLYLLSDFDSSGTPGQIKAIDLARNYVSGLRTEELGIEDYISNLDTVSRTLYMLSGRQGQRKVIALDKPKESRDQHFSSLVRLADINGDGLDDAVTLPDPARGFRIVSINLNRGDGQMDQLAPIAFDASVQNIALANLTNDEQIDLVVMMQDHARLYRGLGDGRFEEEFDWRVDFDGQYRYGRLVEFESSLPSLVVAISTGRLLNFSSDLQGGWTLEDGPVLPGGISQLPNRGQLDWFDMVDADGDYPLDLMYYETAGDEVFLLEARVP